MSSGNGNPVIDLRYISEDLCKLVEQVRGGEGKIQSDADDALFW